MKWRHASGGIESNRIEIFIQHEISCYTCNQCFRLRMRFSVVALNCFLIIQTSICYPSQDSSIGSKLAWYLEGPGFKSRHGQEFFSEKKKLECLNLNTTMPSLAKNYKDIFLFWETFIVIFLIGFRGHNLRKNTVT